MKASRVLTMDSDVVNIGVESADDGGASSYEDETYSLLNTTDYALHPKSNTGVKHLTTSVDLRDSGIETGRVAVLFEMQIPKFACDSAGSGGFTVFKLGSGGAGTITLKVVPITGANGRAPNMIVASITGDVARQVTVRPKKVGFLLSVFLEYNGTDLTLVVGDSADVYHATSVINPPTSPAALTFGADITGMCFDALEIHNKTLSASSYDAPTQFPYILWDNADSGVIAVMPTTYTAGEVKTFIDRGFVAGHMPADLDLTSSTSVASASLYVNEQLIALGNAAGLTAAQFVTWLTTTNAGVVTFSFDSKPTKIKFTATGATTLQAASYDGTTTGRQSYAVRLVGGTGHDWGLTKPIIGKIPGQFYLPYTGKLNEGVSIMGATKSVTSPKALKLTRRDDTVRTTGRVIGSINNRPNAQSMFQIIEPQPWFGCKQAPYPAKSQIWGNSNALRSTLDDSLAYAYGTTYFRWLNIDPPDLVLSEYPNNRSHIGDHIAGFSLDIPFGMILRGMDINFVGMPPGLTGNTPGVDNSNVYNWGYGYLQYPMALTGNSDYTCVYMLLVATDDQGTKWRPVPSIGVDAVKVSGANTWKSIGFKSLDYKTLLDDNGNPLLVGSRRTHFKLVLAAELTAVTYAGMSYKIDSAPKK